MHLVDASSWESLAITADSDGCCLVSGVLNPDLYFRFDLVVCYKYDEL